MFKGMVADVQGNHPVPISNFMNAQCKYIKYRCRLVPADLD
jgi:hypothetical protein